MTRAVWADALGSPPECWEGFVKRRGHYIHDETITDHDPGAECSTGVYIGDAGIDVEFDGLSVLYENLLQ